MSTDDEDKTSDKDDKRSDDEGKEDANKNSPGIKGD